jgi:phospholipid-transporting ATPase
MSAPSGNAPDPSATSSYRLISINDPIKNGAASATHSRTPPQAKHTPTFAHNRISTCKYNLLSFVPKFLYEQFRKYANLFFLFTGCIQLIPDLSPTSRFGTLIPLSIVLLFSAAKEVVEDLRRKAQDDMVNSRLTKVLAGPVFIDRPWKGVCVGDIIRVGDGEFFPADMVLLSSSEPDALCYIETTQWGVLAADDGCHQGAAVDGPRMPWAQVQCS